MMDLPAKVQRLAGSSQDPGLPLQRGSWACWAPPAMDGGSQRAEPSGAGSFLRVRAAQSHCFIQHLGGVAGTALTDVTTTVQVRD